MFNKLFLFVALFVLPVSAEDVDTPFSELGKVPQATVPAFKYKISFQSIPMQGYIMQGRMNGVSTNSTLLQFRAESPERIPGNGRMKLVTGKTTIGDGAIDFAATKEYMLSGMPEYPPDKPAAMFKCEVRRLLLVNDVVRVRLRFKDSTHHFLVRYEDGKGLQLVSIDPANDVQVDAASVGEFNVLTEVSAGTTWYCNALTMWATNDGELLWSTDVPMEGQPKSMKIVGELLFVITNAGHSFYIRKDTGEVAFYVKSVLPGNDPIKEVLEIGRKNMAIDGPRRSLARFILAAVVLNERRSIPFLIDCIEQGDGIPVKLMAVAALEKFGGNPDLWTPNCRKHGKSHYQWVGMKRVYPKENRQAEIARWRKVFAAELDN